MTSESVHSADKEKLKKRKISRIKKKFIDAVGQNLTDQIQQNILLLNNSNKSFSEPLNGLF